MTKNELITYFATVLVSLAEADGPVPESIAYLALGMDIHKWQAVRAMLTAATTSGEACVEIKGHLVSITPAGRELAKKIEDVVKAP